MHGTIGTMKGCGIRPHDQPGEKCPVRRILAAIGFFLLVFGAASIGMGAAIVLSVGSFGTSRPAWNAADVAVHNNDGYLEAYARGPGRGWFVSGQVPCDPQQLRAVVLFERCLNHE
jgi:hypothetical protein